MQEIKFKATRRDLPHWDLEGATYFITFSTWQKQELSQEARKIALNSCLFFNNKRYEIFVLVVMADHVHMLIQPWQKVENEYWSISDIMHSIKSYSSNQISKVMKYTDFVWQNERYDRIVRNEQELLAYWEYIRENPVKAGYSETPEQYPFFWQKP
jgi:putative transposase